MTESLSNQSAIRAMKHVRQARQFHDRPVPDELLAELLDVARWSGSAVNWQPWHFVVIRNPQQRERISQISDRIGWVAKAPLLIAVVMDGKKAITEYFDEGRVTERILLAAHLMGLGGGTAWFDEPDQQAQGRANLGVPEGRVVKSVIALGYPTTIKDPRSGSKPAGRKPLSELVSWETWDGTAPGS